MSDTASTLDCQDVLERTAKIVATYVSNNAINPKDLSKLITNTDAALACSANGRSHGELSAIIHAVVDRDGSASTSRRTSFRQDDGTASSQGATAPWRSSTAETTTALRLSISCTPAVAQRTFPPTGASATAQRSGRPRSLAQPRRALLLQTQEVPPHPHPLRQTRPNYLIAVALA